MAGWEHTIKARAHWPLCLATGGRVFVAGIFIPVGNHYFQALASTLQFVAQVCDRLWLVPATDRAFAYITYMSPPHVALVCSGRHNARPHVVEQSGQCARALTQPSLPGSLCTLIVHRAEHNRSTSKQKSPQTMATAAQPHALGARAPNSIPAFFC